jgi:hypothetical protein
MAGSAASRSISTKGWIIPSWFWWFLFILLGVGFAGFMLLPKSNQLSVLGPCFDPPGTDPWPVPQDKGLGMGYLQCQVEPPSEEAFAHVGIDVLAGANTPVSAIENGTIVLEGGADPDSWVVIESEDEPGTGYLYMHLIRSSHAEDPNGAVAAGEVIAEVGDYTDDKSGNYDHLHLERVRGYDGDLDPITTAGEVWTDYLSYETPLRRLEPASESVAPEFLEHLLDDYLPAGQHCSADMPAAGAWPFWFRDSGSTQAPAKYYCPDQLPFCEELDIVCKVEDRSLTSGGLAVSPCCIEVSIVHDSQGVPERNFSVVFDGAPPAGEGPDHYWSFVRDGALHSGGVWSQPRTMYLVVTNQPTSDGSWKPCKSGQYTITIEIRDATGNVALRSMVVTVL